MLHNVEQLIPAADLEDADMFAHYVRWLDEMLRSRGAWRRETSFAVSCSCATKLRRATTTICKCS